jgi:hypothetical protein
VTTRKKIQFELEQDDDGYPPFRAESLWAEDLGDNKYRVDNIPFFARGISFGDIVLASSPDDGSLPVFREVVVPSDNTTLRVVVVKREEYTELKDALIRLGCDAEWFERVSLLAVNVPASVHYAEVVRLLDDGEAAGRWHYEESAL